MGKEVTNNSNSEVAVIESIEEREFLRFQCVTLKIEQTFSAAKKTFEIYFC